MEAPLVWQKVAKILSLLSMPLWPICKGLHSSIIFLVGEGISCWLAEGKDIHNLLDTSLIQGLGKLSILGLHENNCHHMIQHSLPIRWRISTSSHHHGPADKLLLYLKNSGACLFFIPRKLRSPSIQSVDQ